MGNQWNTTMEYEEVEYANEKQGNDFPIRISIRGELHLIKDESILMERMEKIAPYASRAQLANNNSLIIGFKNEKDRIKGIKEIEKNTFFGSQSTIEEVRVERNNKLIVERVPIYLTTQKVGEFIEGNTQSKIEIEEMQSKKGDRHKNLKIRFEQKENAKKLK